MRTINVSFSVPDDFTLEDLAKVYGTPPEPIKVDSALVLDDDDMANEDQYLLYLLEFVHTASPFEYGSPLSQGIWRMKNGIVRTTNLID